MCPRDRIIALCPVKLMPRGTFIHLLNCSRDSPGRLSWCDRDIFLTPSPFPLKRHYATCHRFLTLLQCWLAPQKWKAKYSTSKAASTWFLIFKSEHYLAFLHAGVQERDADGSLSGRQWPAFITLFSNEYHHIARGCYSNRRRTRHASQ